MDFTNEINTLESEKLRLEEMLKRNNDRLQLLKEASTEPSSDGYRRFFKLKGYTLEESVLTMSVSYLIVL